MTDKPIIIPAIRIPALHEGRMTQMRAPLDPQPKAVNFNGILLDENVALFDHGLGYVTIRDGEKIPLPYSIGDRLWVQEEFCGHVGTMPGDMEWQPDWVSSPDGEVAAFYRADRDGKPFDHSQWRSPDTMPRWASRTTLVVNDVRVQRVQEISSCDVLAEGVEQDLDMLRAISLSQSDLSQRECFHRAHVQPFRTLWNTLHGPDAWDRNDWVCAISFDVHRCNIDQMPGDV